MAGGFETSTCVTSDIHPLTKPYLRSLPKECRKMGATLSSARDFGCHLLQTIAPHHRWSSNESANYSDLAVTNLTPVPTTTFYPTNMHKSGSIKAHLYFKQALLCSQWRQAISTYAVDFSLLTEKHNQLLSFSFSVEEKCI